MKLEGRTQAKWARINPQLLTGVVNTGDVVVGDESVSLTNSPNILAVDPAFEITAPHDAPFDLSEIFVDAATDDDGVGVWYLLG